MINLLTGLLGSQKAKVSDSTASNDENERNKSDLMYPPHLSRRMLISSFCFLFNSLSALFCGYLDLAVVSSVTCIASLNHWRYPIFSSIRRSIDLVVAQGAVAYYVHSAFHNLTASQWSLYLYGAVGGLLLFYAGALYFGFKGNQDFASRSHSIMHFWGIAGNTFLFYSMFQNERK